MHVPPVTLLVLLFVVAPLAGATTYTYAGGGVAGLPHQPLLIGPDPTSACMNGPVALCNVPCPGVSCHVSIRDAADPIARAVNTLEGNVIDTRAQVEICDQAADGTDQSCFPPGNPVTYHSHTGTIDIFIFDGTAGTITVS